MNKKKTTIDRFKNKVNALRQENSKGLNAYLFQVKDAILNDFSEDISSQNIVTYQLVNEENSSGMRMHYLADSMRADASQEERYLNYQVFQLAQKNIHQLAEPYLNNNMNILELGAGCLDGTGDSAISSAFSKDIAANFLFCDINPAVVQQSLSLFSDARIMQADILKLSHVYPKNTFDMIVGLNVLDTLSKESLKTAYEEIGCLLKNDGHFLHVMNLEPYIYSSIHNIIDDAHFVIPCLPPYGKRCFIKIDKQTTSYNAALSEQEQDLLYFVSGLSQKQMERFVISTIYQDKEGAIINLGKRLLHAGETITPMEAYLQNQLSAAKSCGFNLITNQYSEHTKAIRAQINGHYDRKHIQSGPNGMTIEPDEELEWSHATLTIQSHALLLKK